MALRATTKCSLWHVVVCCLALAGSGCASQQDSFATTPVTVPNLPVETLALFSTYTSDAARAQCETTTMACREDALSPGAFLSAFKDSANNHKLVQTADYELLIANLGREQPDPGWFSWLTRTPPATTQFAEFTLTWRGIELSSRVVEGTYPRTIGQKAMAQALISKWWNDVSDQAIFSASYIYRQLDASNYDAELKLPDSIDNFHQAITELYPDPLEGVISRYTHPDFQDALVDISIYPIRQSLSLATTQILDEELHNELAQAQSVATTRKLELSMIHTAQDTQVMTEQGPGRRLALAASSPSQDTIYASIYAFRLQDKIIKITTTMPPDYSDPLIQRALPAIDVPGESPLMVMLRAKNRNAPPSQRKPKD